jgi:hypothetical protein
MIDRWTHRPPSPAGMGTAIWVEDDDGMLGSFTEKALRLAGS